METLNADKYITLKVQKRFKSLRNCYVRYWIPYEIYCITGDLFDRQSLDRNILLFHSDLYKSERNIYIYYYRYTRYNEKDLIIVPLKYHINERKIETIVIGQQSINVYELLLPIIKYGEKKLYVEGNFSSQRKLSLCLLYRNEKFCKVARTIKLDTNETKLNLPTTSINDKNIFIHIGFITQRHIKICLTINNSKDIFVSLYRGQSVNETDLNLPFINYGEINLYLVGHLYSDKNIFLKLNQIHNDKVLYFVPFSTYFEDKPMLVEILRGHSINETKIYMAYLKWSNRFIYAPWIVYNSEKRIFIPTSIQSTFFARTPLDICINVKDLEKTIDGMFHVGIDSIIIKDENNNLLTYITEEDYEKGIVRTKIENVFPERNRVRKLKFEIFTSQGKQLDNKERKLLFSGNLFGKVIK